MEFSRRGNLQKYRNRNPLQRFLIWHFHRGVGAVVAGSGARTILDVGCGEGFTIDGLLRMDGHLPIQGVDHDWQALLDARERLPEIFLQRGDVLRLPYSSDSFELVLCLEVLEHLPDPLPALKELQRVSSHHCLISVPNEPFFMISNLLRGKNVRGWGNDPEHLQRWTAAQFRRMLREYFDVVRVYYPFPWVVALCRT